MLKITPAVQKVYNYAGSASQYIADHIPAYTPSREGVLRSVRWLGEKCSGPQNRLILGVTALMSQPFIDLNNKKVDEKTREVSAARTVAKIIVGTTTGFTVRYLTIKAIEKFSKFFAPSFPVKNYKQYSMALGNFMSLGIIMFTNFAIDAPWTKSLTNRFIARIDKYHEKHDNQKIKEDTING